MADWLTEWGYGGGAVKLVGKLLIQETVREPAKALGVKTANLIAGVLITDNGDSLLSGDKFRKHVKQIDAGLEMWEVELIIIPKRKYRFNKSEHCYAAMTIDQKLTGSWWSRESWKEQIFGEEDK